MIRFTKCAAACIIGLIGLLAFLDNANNLQSAFSVIEFVVSGAEQPYYKIIGPTISSPAIIWIVLFSIMAIELLVGVLGLWGLGQMIKHLRAGFDEFQHAKSMVLLGASTGMLLWYGAFVVIGELYFNFWQTETGLASAEGAFRYGTICAVLYVFIATKND